MLYRPYNESYRHTPKGWLVWCTHIRLYSFGLHLKVYKGLELYAMELKVQGDVMCLSRPVSTLPLNVKSSPQAATRAPTELSRGHLPLQTHTARLTSVFYGGGN